MMNYRSDKAHSILWQYSHSVCLRPKIEGEFPGGESFSSATQSGTWACTISLSSHQQLPLLKGKKNSTAVYLSKICDFASPKMIGNPLDQYLILLSAFKFWTVNKFNTTKHRLRNTLYTYNFCAPFVAFAIPPRTKALTLPSPPPSKAARNSS